MKDLINELMGAVIFGAILFFFRGSCSNKYDKSDSYNSSQHSISSEPMQSTNSDAYDYCRMCQKTFRESELVMRETSPRCYNRVCSDCAEKLWMRNGVKAARNKWVDDNPIEARRRGITKF